MEGTGWNRREFTGGAVLLALAVGVPGGAALLEGLNPKDAPSDRQRAMMREVSELVIPATDTPGAAAAGVGDFVLLALAHGLNGARDALNLASISGVIRGHLRRDGSLRYAAWLESVLDRAAGGDWLSKAATRKVETLSAIDAEAFSENTEYHPWKMIKSLILLGYYTSEIGGAEELQYDPVPGRYDPAVEITPETRAYSNEWTGVDFG